jgi:hypothetical protein
MIGWFSANGLALNMEKTKIMKFTSSPEWNLPNYIPHKDSNWNKQHKIFRTRTWQKYKLKEPCSKNFTSIKQCLLPG